MSSTQLILSLKINYVSLFQIKIYINIFVSNYSLKFNVKFNNKKIYEYILYANHNRDMDFML
jgi:hypothetical protein